MNSITNIDEKLTGIKSVGIAGHVRPDGDCAGSTLAVYNYIRTYYPKTDVRLYLEPIPNIFKFLQNAEEIRNECTDTENFDLFIVLDCGDKMRLGSAAKYFESAGHTLCIDHHVSNQAFADDNYILPDASSTCELVFDLMDKDKITKEIAECLYTGMVHDTGVFKYSCTSPKTMRAAAVLMEKGIDFPKIVDETFFTKTYRQNRVMGQVLLDSKLYLDGNEDGSYKVSFRVNGDFDAAELAMHFGGGGHVKAAGCTMGSCLEKNIELLLSEIAKRL